MMLAAANFAHISASLLLFGAALFPLYAGNAGAAWRSHFQRASAWAALLAGAVAIALHARIIDAPVRALIEAGIGRVWLAQLLLGVALTFLTHCRARTFFLALLAAANVCVFGLTGHANAISGWIGVWIESLHLLSAGLWLGGIAALLLALRDEPTQHLVRRFSRVALPAVVMLAATGAGILFINTGAPLPAMSTAYGRMASAKIVLFALALVLAALNSLYSTPRGAWALLVRCIVVEGAIMGVIVAAAVALANLEPYG